MSEMIERVARAMWQGEWNRAKAHERAANEAAGRDVYVSYVPRWEDCNLIFLGYARAAIEAMREPTHEIISAMATSNARDDEGEFGPLMDLIDFSGENKLHTLLREAWRAAIDAALNASP